MPNTLPVSRLIRVAVTLTQAAAQAQSTKSMLVLGASDVIDTFSRLRSYASLASVAADFGNAAPEYFAAQAWFAQKPQPNSILIGRWAQVAASGKLIGATLTANASLIATWQAIANGSFKYAVDGGAITAVAGLNFAAVQNLNGVAAIISAALVGATCTYNAVYNRFEFKSNTTGANSSFSFLTAGAAGTTIDALSGGTAASGGYLAQGVAAETAAAVAALFDNQFGQQFYGLAMPTAVAADHVAVASYIEAAATKHFYWITTQDAATLNALDVASLAYQLKQLAITKSAVQYSSTSAYAALSLAGRMLTVDYNGNNTVITAMYKQEPLVVAEALSTSQADALDLHNVSYFAAFDNNTNIIVNGKVPSGDFIDNIIGADSLGIAMQTALYNALYTSPTRIPQTDSGNNILCTVAEGVCGRYVGNGLGAPGIWDSNGFGTLNQGDFLSKGFYVYAAPVSTQAPADRAARKSMPIQTAFKYAGAVHSVDVAVTINR